MFDFSQLRCFVAVAEELNFGRAATRLNMTQPPLSRQIQMLEHTLDVRLLDRTSRSVSLTPAGRAFLIEARRILGMVEGATLTARRVARGEAGSITVGFTAKVGYTLLPRIVAQCAVELPGVELVLKEMVTGDQIKALISNQIDVGFLRMSLDLQEFDNLFMTREPMVAALAADHRLAGSDPLAVTDFEGERIVMYSPYEARYFHDMVTSIFALENVSPRYVQYLTQTHTILAMVRDGIGSAIVPKSAELLGMSGLVFRPLQTLSEILVEVRLSWRRHNNNPALPGFLKTMAGLAELE